MQNLGRLKIGKANVLYESQTLFEATKFFELMVGLILFDFCKKKIPFHSSVNLFILLSHVNQGRKYITVLFILTLKQHLWKKNE